MERRHDDALTARIEQVSRFGWTEIKWWELYLWYGRDKIAKRTWRDLKARYEELDPSNVDLHIYESDEGVLLIHSDGLQPISKKLGDEESD